MIVGASLLTTSPAVGATTKVYDAQNRLVAKVDDSGSTTVYRYDAQGMLAGIGRDGRDTDLIVDPRGQHPRVVGLVTDAGTSVRYAHGPESVLARSEAGGGIRATLVDRLGSVVGLVSAQGEVSERTAYDAYGQRRTGSGSDGIGYTGEFQDATDTVWLRARHYDPNVGRFLQRDDFRGWVGRPSSLNRYTYADGNPLGNVDPTGNYAETAWDVFSLGMGVHAISQWDQDTSMGTRIFDVLGLGADLVSVVLPFVPGGFGALRASRKAMTVGSDAVRHALGTGSDVRHLDGVPLRPHELVLPPGYHPNPTIVLQDHLLTNAARRKTHIAGVQPSTRSVAIGASTPGQRALSGYTDLERIRGEGGTFRNALGQCAEPHCIAQFATRTPAPDLSYPAQWMKNNRTGDVEKAWRYVSPCPTCSTVYDAKVLHSNPLFPAPRYMDGVRVFPNTPSIP